MPDRRSLSAIITVALLAGACASGGQLMPSQSKAIPVACIVGALSAQERVRSRALREELVKAVEEVQEHEHGFAFRYRADPDVARKLVEWIVLERKCCPFLSFELRWVAGTESPWLELSGPEGTKEFLRAELPMLDGGAGPHG